MKFWLPVFLLFLALAAVFVFGPGQLIEPDQFYHITHAAVYAQNGIFRTDFPWTQFSVWKTYQADIWYGFHLLLIPFTVFSDLTLGVKMAATLFAALALLGFYFVLKRHEIRWPFFWTLLFYFATPNLLFRLNQLRPNTLTIAFLALIFSFLIRPFGSVQAKPATKKSWLLLAALAFAIPFLHLAFFWIAPLVTAVVAIVTARVEKKHFWQMPASVIAGTLLGWLSRPNPFGAAKILWIQLFELIAAKRAGVPLLSGDELRPLNGTVILTQLIPILAVWLIAIGILAFALKSKKFSAAPSEMKRLVWSASCLSIVFLALGFTLGRRATDFFALFAVILAASLFSWWHHSKKPAVSLVFGCLLLVMLTWHSYLYTTYAAEPAGGADQLRTASLWLKDHSRPGDTVFHTSWDSFPMLFFWNDRDYYINGADPIFEYAYNPKLYFENFFLAVGGKPYTCPALPCTPQDGKSLYEAIAGDFRAKYVMVELDRNAGFAANLAADPHFEKVFATENELVYRVK